MPYHQRRVGSPGEGADTTIYKEMSVEELEKSKDELNQSITNLKKADGNHANKILAYEKKVRAIDTVLANKQTGGNGGAGYEGVLQQAILMQIIQ